MFTKPKILAYICVLAAFFIFILISLLKRPAPANKTEPEYKNVMTSLFWVGETSDESNDFVPNHESYWDSFWMEHYGGIDSPKDRCGYSPCGFSPRENPFYFALPYGDRDENGEPKQSLSSVPWYGGTAAGQNVLKNRWIEVKYRGKTCYAQWEDVGPAETDDFEYVFGGEAPQNTFGVRAGLDISPAVWNCLGLRTNSVTSWRFVKEEEVPPGPWKLVVTRSQVSF